MYICELFQSDTHVRSRSLSRGLSPGSGDTGVREENEQHQHERGAREEILQQNSGLRNRQQEGGVEDNNNHGGDAIPQWALRKLESIEEVLDRICSKIGLGNNWDRDEGEGFKVLREKLLAVEKYVEHKEIMKLFKESLDNYAEAVGGEGSKQAAAPFFDDYEGCRSIKQLEQVGPFKYKIESETMECELCKTVAAHYNMDQEEDFSGGRVQSTDFRNLKRSLKRHLTTGKHQNAVKEKQVEEEKQVKVKCRNKKIGKVLGPICYFLLKHGRPYTDFEELVFLLSRAGVDVGVLNHSRKFVPKWSEICAGVIEKRLKNFFHTVMPQTGRVPVAKVAGDKGTWKHETNMLTGLVTVVPDSDEPIQAFFVSSKACPGGSGEAQARSMVEAVEPYLAVKEQYLGLCADGHTLHCGVGKKLSEHFEQEGHDDYDPMHKAGRVDAHMRSEAQFSFIDEIIDIISSVYKMVSFLSLCH